MIVRLTHPQWNAVRSRIDPEMVEIMKEHRTSIPSGHDYLLPAVGWRRVLDDLSAVAYGPLGGKVTGSTTLYRAIARISDKVGMMESHPAMTTGLAVAGIGTEVVPIWVSDDPYHERRSPYPSPHAKLLVFHPEHCTSRDRLLTWWRVGDSDPHQVLHDPAFHLRVAGVSRATGTRVPELDGGSVQ
jgi:hypothetical protein